MIRNWKLGLLRLYAVVFVTSFVACALALYDDRENVFDRSYDIGAGSRYSFNKNIKTNADAFSILADIAKTSPAFVFSPEQGGKNEQAVEGGVRTIRELVRVYLDAYSDMRPPVFLERYRAKFHPNLTVDGMLSGYGLRYVGMTVSNTSLLWSFLLIFLVPSVIIPAILAIVFWIVRGFRQAPSV